MIFISQSSINSISRNFLVFSHQTSLKQTIEKVFDFIKIVPKYFLESFRNKLKIDEIKEELSETMNFDNDKKMTPQKIKDELDKYIIGQDHVKKALAISLRN